MITNVANPVAPPKPVTSPMNTGNDMEPTSSNDRFQLSDMLEENLVQVFKLLSDPNRLKILMSLARAGELHVTALCELLGQSQPAVSHHLALLRGAKLIESRRAGKHNFYSIRTNQFHWIMAELFNTISDPVTEEVRFNDFVLTQDTP